MIITSVSAARISERSRASGAVGQREQGRTSAGPAPPVTVSAPVVFRRLAQNERFFVILTQIAAQRRVSVKMTPKMRYFCDKFCD